MTWTEFWSALGAVFNSVEGPGQGRRVNWRLILVIVVGVSILLAAVAVHDVTIQGGG